MYIILCLVRLVTSRIWNCYIYCWSFLLLLLLKHWIEDIFANQPLHQLGLNEFKNPDEVHEGHAKDEGYETADLEIHLYAVGTLPLPLYLCHHLEEGEGHHLLGHLDHLVEVDGDCAGVVVDAGQEGGGEGHVCAWLLLRRIRRVPVVRGCLEI